MAWLLFFLPFKGAIRSALIFFSRQLKTTPRKYSQEIEELKKDKIALSLQLEEFKQLKEENDILRDAFDLKIAEKLNLIGTEVIAFSPSNWHREVVINTGIKSGVSEGLLVIDENGGLVGRILKVENNSSRLLLVSDPNFNVPVFVGKEAFGMFKGNLVGAKILYIEDGDKIASGDKVWLKNPSSGSVIQIGKVGNVKKSDASLFWDVDVELFLKASVFDKLFIVK